MLTPSRVQEFLATSAVSESRENLENLSLEIYEFLSSGSSSKIDSDLFSKITTSLGFALGLLDDRSASSPSSFEAFLCVLKSIKLLVKRSLGEHVVQDALIVSYLLHSCSIQNSKMEADEEFILFLDIWQGLSPYYKQLSRLATPKFLDQFKILTLRHIKSSTVWGEVRVGAVMMEILLGLVTNLAKDSAGLCLLTSADFQSHLLGLLSHPEVLVSACAVAILNCVVTESEVRQQVFCPDNVQAIGELIVKLINTQAQNVVFRRNMMQLIYSLENEGMCPLDLISAIASKARLKDSNPAIAIELIASFSKTRLSRTDTFYSFEFDQDFLSHLLAYHNEAKEKMVMVEFFDAHIPFLVKEMSQNPGSWKVALFSQAWTSIFNLELEKTIKGMEKIEFLNAAINLINHGLFKCDESTQALIITLLQTKKQTSEYAVSLLLILEGADTLSMDQNKILKDLLPSVFPMYAQECLKGSAASISKVARLLQSKKRGYGEWLAQWNLRKSVSLDQGQEKETLSLPMMELATNFKNILQTREVEHRMHVESLSAQISALSIMPKVDAAASRTDEPIQWTAPVAYSEKMIATIQEVKSQSKKHQLECAQLREEKEILEINAGQLEADFQDATLTSQKMASKVQALESKLSSCHSQMQKLQAEISEKTALIADLQAELDEQTEYQAMVAKLAATVNRRKPGGMAAPPPPARNDRKVPAIVESTTSSSIHEDEETLSQVFY